MLPVVCCQCADLGQEGVEARLALLQMFLNNSRSQEGFARVDPANVSFRSRSAKDRVFALTIHPDTDSGSRAKRLAWIEAGVEIAWLQCRL